MDNLLNERLAAAVSNLLAALESIRAKAAESGNMPGIPDETAALFYDIVEDSSDAIAAAKGESING